MNGQKKSNFTVTSLVGKPVKLVISKCEGCIPLACPLNAMTTSGYCLKGQDFLRLSLRIYTAEKKGNFILLSDFHFAINVKDTIHSLSSPEIEEFLNQDLNNAKMLILSDKRFFVTQVCLFFCLSNFSCQRLGAHKRQAIEPLNETVIRK